MELNKVILGVWYETKIWHIVKKKYSANISDNDYYALCNSGLWIDNTTNNNSYLFPGGDRIDDALKLFNFNHICKRCLKIKPEATETIKTYIIYHKLGIKI